MSNGTGWSTRLKRLNDLLAELYPDEMASRQVVRKAGLPPGAIRFHPAAGTNWFNILEEAQRRKRIDAVVDVARTDYPERDEWAELAETPEHTLTNGASSPASHTPDRAGTRWLDAPSRQQLHEALLSAFVSSAELDQMLSFRMNIPLAQISGNHSLRETVFNIIRWAESQGRVDELISAATAANPGNSRLSAFVQAWRTP